MINQQILRGNWNEIKGMLRSKWGSITEDDLSSFNGNVEQLVGTIQRKSGEARERVEQFLEQLTSEGSAAVSQAAETVREYAHQVADSVQETSHRAAASVRKRYAEVENVVRQRPAASLAVLLGVGVITGVVMTLLLRGQGHKE